MSDDTTSTAHMGLYIDGAVVDHGAAMSVPSPANALTVVGTVAQGTVEDAEAAVQAAAKAAPTWAATTAAVRAAALEQIATVVEGRADELARVVARENGSMLATVQREVMGAVDHWRQVAGRLEEQLAPRQVPTHEGDFVRISRKPYGVVGLIVPWNAPLILTVNKLVPAIAAGNTVVVKPSPLSPLGSTMIATIAAQELPPGVVNVLNGDGEIGAALIDHPLVRKVSFTGGGATARHIMRQAADGLKDVHFELGGNDPAIILPDVDVDKAVERLGEAAFRRAGQVCFAVKRVYVPRSLATEFIEKFSNRIDRIAVGDPLDPDASMGPVNNQAQYDRVDALVEGARAAGRDVRELGTRLPSADENGFYRQPTLVVDARQDDELVRVEQFGPVLPIITYDDEEQAIAWANDTDYGLCSSVWSEDRDHALAVADRIESGSTILNNHLFSRGGTREVPFGGWKQSGIGYEASPYGIAEYLQFHSVDVQS